MGADKPFAKSTKQGAIYLDEHLRQVASYAGTVADAYYPHWKRLYGEETANRVRRALIIAGLTHDLGKATSGFQRCLRGECRTWDFRHEVLSASLVQSLIKANEDEETFLLILGAILTHHREIFDISLATDAAWSLPIDDPEKLREKFRSRAKELEEYRPWIEEFAGQHLVDLLRSEKVSLAISDLEPPDRVLDTLKKKTDCWKQVHEQESMSFLRARGWLMASDHAVSAGLTEFRQDIPQLRVNTFRPFQQEVGAHVGHAFLEAPTGAGKTIASLLWALTNRIAGERIFYLLPYQASVEAMADTLKQHFDNDSVAVLHARALDYAFQEYFEQSGEYTVAYARASAEENINRLAHKPIKVMTPFQILKWLFGVRRFEIGISEMVGGLYIFDEIHAYDAHVIALIAEMVQFIQQLGGRCLFMSATFPNFLKELLRQKVSNEEIPTFSLQECNDEWTRQILKPRHKLRWQDASLEELCPRIVELAQSQKRVLVVANRVAQAQEIYKKLKEALPDGVHLLHSRYTRRDRVQKEREILQKMCLREQNDIKVLVATQVVEVSLDISFDTMFTEIAPVDDLLQRLGRVNRYGEHEKAVDVYISTGYNPEKLKWVYDIERVERTVKHKPPDGTELTPQDATSWVNEVYADGFTERENERYRNVSESFRNIIGGLRPLHSRSNGGDLEGLFQSVEVLPEKLLEEYRNLINQKQYLLANALLVPIPRERYNQIKDRKRDEKGGIGNADYRVKTVKADYSEELGLQLTSDEPE